MAPKPQVGDVVHVKGTVCDASPTGEGLEIDFGPCTPGTWVNPHSIVHVEPAPLKVGDSVIWLGDITVPFKRKATILAIDTGINQPLVWIRESEGPPAGRIIGRIVPVDQLKRADEPRPLKVGDKVRYGFGWAGTIVELPDVTPDSAKVRVGSEIKHLNKSDLERVE